MTKKGRAVIWRVAFLAFYPIWRVLCWLWVRHDIRAVRRAWYAAGDVYAVLYAKSGRQV